MKLGEFKKLLEGLDDGLLVVLAENEEEYGFSLLEEVTDSIGFVALPNSSFGELRFRKLTKELEAEGFDASDIDESAVPCVVLWTKA